MTQYVPSSFVEEQDESMRQWQYDSFDGVRDSQSSPASDAGRDEGDRVTLMASNDLEQQEQDEERVDSALPKARRRRKSPSPELSAPIMQLRTPRRRFKSEIPSSNTPQSAILSISAAKSMRSPERSPLRTKSTNVWPRHPSPHKAEMSPVPESPVKPVSPFHISPVKNRPVFRVPNKPPSLQHRSTIPDSEDTATQITPAKKAKFRSQVPDTQFEMFGEEVAPITETQFPLATYTQYGGETYYAENDEYHDFDPVCSALDRDAARYMQTQRLREQLRQDAFRNALSFTQTEPDEQPDQVPAEQSQELGDHVRMPDTDHGHANAEPDDPPTQSPHSSPHPPQVQHESDEIEELDLTGDVITPKNSVLQVIRIASSPSSKSISSGKYPSSPPLAAENGPPLQPIPDSVKASLQRHSSPPLPVLNVAIPPSQVSTVGGTQFLHHTSKQNKGLVYVSSSPPALPPSTSSPPPEARQQLRKLLQVYDSEDEEDIDIEDSQSFYQDGENQDLDLDFVPRNQDDEDHEKSDDGADDVEESEHTLNRSRLRDILPDTLLDFSLPPPPPTQSSLRSLRL